MNITQDPSIILDQIEEHQLLMKRAKRYYTKLSIQDGKFTHSSMARCFFLLRRSLEASPDDYKYCDEYTVNIRQIFIIVRNLMNQYTQVTGQFPYCNDLQELLVAYVELECLVYCKSSFELHNQSDVEAMIVQTLYDMLYDGNAVTEEEVIKNADDICILRCLYTLKMVSLKIRFVNPLIENMASKLSAELKEVKLCDENYTDYYETGNSNMEAVHSSSISAFFKKCHAISAERLYYFDDNDEAEADQLLPVYNPTAATKAIKKSNNLSNKPLRHIKVTCGVITDTEVIALMEYHRDRFCKDTVFQYIDVDEEIPSPTVIVVDDESDNDSDNKNTNYKRHKGDVGRSYSPISIDSDVEDVSSFMVNDSVDRNSCSSNSVIESSFQSPSSINNISHISNGNNSTLQVVQNEQQSRKSKIGLLKLCTNLKAVSIDTSDKNSLLV